MKDPQRLANDGSAAALLLGAARKDTAPRGAKARALASLGLEAPETAPKREMPRVIPRESARLEKSALPRMTKPARPALFQSIVGPAPRQASYFEKGRFGAALVAGVQAALLVIVLLSQPVRTVDPVAPAAGQTPSGIDIEMMAPPPAPPKDSPASASPAPERPRSAPNHAPAPKPEEKNPPPPAEIAVDEAYAATSPEPEPQNVEAPKVAEAPKPEANENDAPLRNFDDIGVTRPKRVGGRDAVYTREALEMRVEGKAIMQCVILASGETRNCRIIKGLPHMDAELLAAAQTWRFTPAMSGGKPMNVRYTFTISLVLPK